MLYNSLGGEVIKLYNFPLNMHIGNPSIPICKKGDWVERGQMIAKMEGMGANIHTSVSGIVVSVDEAQIRIEADQEQKESYCKMPKRESALEMVREAGIVGMGGAGFPTYFKLAHKISKGTLIVNAAECEPLLRHNILQAEKQTQLLWRGIEIVKEIVEAEKVVIGIKEKHKQVSEILKQSMPDSENYSIANLPDMYPVGEERALCYVILGKLLEATQLPSELNALVINVETLTRIAEAVDDCKPCISKNLTVIGPLKNDKTSQVLWDLPIGISVREILEKVGLKTAEFGEIVLGGPFTGKSASLDSPILKTTGGLIWTIEFPKEKQPMGLLVCACGADESRLREIANNMSGEVVGVEYCKQAIELKGKLKCENPGHCPGQAEKVLKLRKAGAKVLLISNCSDCTNTVMCIAPNLKMPVYHSTDHIMRTARHGLIRKLK